MMAQTSKLTLDAHMQAERHQATTRTKAPGTTVGTLSAIVKLDEANIDKTLDCLRTMGVKLQGRLGQQVAAAIPLDVLQQVEDMQGVLRIGTGGPAPKLLTDISRGEIGVSDIDGTRGMVGDKSYSGKGEITEAVEAICQEGVPLVISAGNEGNRRLYLHKDFESDTDTLRSMIAMKDKFENIEGFVPKDADLCMRLSLVKKDGDNTWKTLWQSPMLKPETGILPDIISEGVPALDEGFSGILRLGVSREPDQVRMKICGMGMLREDYFLELTIGSKQGVGLDIFNAELTSGGRAGFLSSVDGMLQNDWATAPSCISAGAYTTNTMVRSLYDEPLPSIDETLNDIAPLSSYGTGLNGVHVPTICAPGINIVAAVSHFNVEKDDKDNPKPYRPDMTWQGFPYNAESGTSMAAPTVAGTIALWLEANPKLTPAEVKDIVCRSARTDAFTEAKPAQFGHGMIDAKRGLEMVLNAGTGIREISEGQWNENATMYDLQGRPCRQPRAKGIYISNGKKVIIK